MRKVLAFTLALACLLSLTGCGCEHEWIAATCTEAETCVLCGEVQGEKAAHIWAQATCEAPQTCASCGLSRGEKLPHSWMDATTEEPQTCETCGATQGDRIITDERFTTANNQALFGIWKLALDAGELFPEPQSVSKDFIFVLSLEFHNDGTLELFAAEEDINSFLVQFREAYLAMIYTGFEAAGMDEEDAQEFVMDTLGMTVEEYADAQLAEMSFETNLRQGLGSFSNRGVYYVDEDLLYVGSSWEDPMVGTPFLLEGDMLSFPEDFQSFGTVVFHRAEP